LLDLIDGFDGDGLREHLGHVVYAVKCEVIEFVGGAILGYFLGG
jgi:hypothetical protein